MDKLYNIIKFAFVGAGVMELLLYASEIGRTQVNFFDTGYDMQQIRLGMALVAFLLYFVVELMEPA